MRCERVRGSCDEEEVVVVDWKRRVDLGVERTQGKNEREVGLCGIKDVCSVLCCLRMHCCGL